MRTPGHDFDLAAGFLVSEGVITRAEHFSAARYCAGATEEGLNTYNVLDVTLAPGVAPPDPSLERSFYTTSSCGLCGKASIDAVRTASAYGVRADTLRIDDELLTSFPEQLRAKQAVFEKTGGLHAAALFDGVSGEMLVIREDVGRHNAVDKVIGWALKEDRLPLRGTVLMVSGRASFELTQKAMMAGIPVLAAVSAPSSLAAELATEVGMTLVGFLRGSSMVIYAGAERIRSVPSANRGLDKLDHRWVGTGSRPARPPDGSGPGLDRSDRRRVSLPVRHEPHGHRLVARRVGLAGNEFAVHQGVGLGEVRRRAAARRRVHHQPEVVRASFLAPERADHVDEVTVGEAHLGGVVLVDQDHAPTVGDPPGSGRPGRRTWC